ncbi:hypothetical protein BJ741DRAFT_365653 [Chytriomyces cf. hyalinus JEL632]|nr:hypothetical protein BJ741DRAFT_365653 [Chytriomyces cf. hyalinus JEL632]
MRCWLWSGALFLVQCVLSLSLSLSQVFPSCNFRFVFLLIFGFLGNTPLSIVECLFFVLVSLVPVFFTFTLFFFLLAVRMVCLGEGIADPSSLFPEHTLSLCFFWFLFQVEKYSRMILRTNILLIKRVRFLYFCNSITLRSNMRYDMGGGGM